MNKHEEIAHYRDFVKGLSDGYLRDMLKGSEGYIEDAIRSDHAFTGTLQRWAGLRQNHQAMADDLGRQVIQRRQELKTLDHRMENLTEKAKDIAATIELLARDLRAVG